MLPWKIIVTCLIHWTCFPFLFFCNKPFINVMGLELKKNKFIKEVDFVNFIVIILQIPIFPNYLDFF